MSRVIKFRAWNDIDKSYIDWMTLCGMPKLITNIARGKEKHYQLEQYTGLKDMNGVEIYEGDILTNEDFSDEADDMVVIMNERGCFVASDRDNSRDFLFLDDLDFVVVGNIHQSAK